MADFEKLQELTQRLVQGVQDTFGSKHFQEYLKLLSSFHQYSARNSMLIFLQRPDATHVAGFNSWKKRNRYVKRGEKGIFIYAPVTYKSKLKEKRADEKGEESVEEVEQTCLTFKPTAVFDVSQTDGEPLPTICNELQGKVNGSEQIFNALKMLSPYRIRFEQIENGSKGSCNVTDRVIVIKLGMSDEQTIKTLIHEIAHATFHGDLDIDRRCAEVQAESTAYVVSQFLGVDTSSYSFDYVARWSQDMDAETLQKTLERIQLGAHTMICQLEENLNILEQNRAQNSKPQRLSDRIESAKQQAETQQQEHIKQEVINLGQSVFQ